jgi:hypothetical protein
MAQPDTFTERYEWDVIKKTDSGSSEYEVIFLDNDCFMDRLLI